MKSTFTLIFSLLAMSVFSQNTFPSSGNAGVGTTEPLHELEVRTDVPNGIGPTLLLHNNQYNNSEGAGSAIKFLGISNFISRRYIAIEGVMRANANPDYLAFRFSNKGGETIPLVLKYNGRVGIGTATPREKLSVNGSVRAKEVKVEASPWPDYVFEDGYKLLPIAELKTYVKEHKHLPGIPSAADVAGDGLSLGKMNAKLLEKIEELTRHLIDQSELLEKQQTLIEDQQKRIKAIEEKLRP